MDHNHPGHDDWKQGRTHFPDPDPWVPTGQFPRVEGDVCIIEHHLFDPLWPGGPGIKFLGGEIHSLVEFAPSKPYHFEARVRWNTETPYATYPEGFVNSFFVYGDDGSPQPDNDEIDFEFTSKPINGDWVFLNTWNESCQKPECMCNATTEECIAPPGVAISVPDALIPTQWNVFRIYWYPNLRRVEWTWLDPVNGETWLRTDSDACWVPDESMSVYFNFWAAGTDWACARSSPPDPVGDASANEVYAYEIDYVEVRTPANPYPPQYVDEVVSEIGGYCPCPPNEASYYEPASRILGAPNWLTYNDGVEWWGSPRTGGEFLFKFARALVVDGPGADLRFWQGNGGGGERATVRVSLDGVTFSPPGSWPYLNDDVHTGGDPSPSSDGYYFDFDLKSTGLQAIRYVWISDIDNDPAHDPWDAPDIDAIEALHLNAIPAVSSWGLAILILVVLCAGTVLLVRRRPGSTKACDPVA